LQIEYTDLDPIPSGRVGLYTEDARVLFQQPVVTPLTAQVIPTGVGTATRPARIGTPNLPAQPTNLPTPVPPTLATIYQRATEAESALRTGQLRATIDYGNGSRSKLVAEFDLEASALHLLIDYESTTGSRRDEFVTIGERSWQRQGTAPWVVVKPPGSVSEQLDRYFPHLAATSVTAVGGDPVVGSLRWLNPDGASETTVTVDPATGVLRSLRQVARTNGPTLAVTYSNINTPIPIVPPVGTP
jgi:hypothetical protein